MKNEQLRRIVVKIGSSSLTHGGGKLNLTRIGHYLRQLVDLKNQGREVLLVTSGAIYAGMGELKIEERPRSIPQQQGLAAIGQGLLMTVYNRFLREYGELGAQILLTASDLEDRERYLNAFNTLQTLLKYGVIPIINENDTVATGEIKFGDNDTLSARVAGLVEADLLVILSDIEGVYQSTARESGNQAETGQTEDDSRILRMVEEITPELEALAGEGGSTAGTGGMRTKLEAARIAINSGITMVIGPGYRENILLEMVSMLESVDRSYNLGTTFLPGERSLSKREQWFYYNLPASGSLRVDSGAEEALLYRGKSLLPGGVLTVMGSFSRGALVEIIDQKNRVLGKGLVNYSSEEIEKIMGHQSKAISALLGYVDEEEVIHRDNLVIERRGDSF